MNRFQAGQQRLNKHFLKYAKVQIIYHRVANDGSNGQPVVTGLNLTIDVWPGEYLFKIMEKDNQRMEWSDRDYLIPVLSLVEGSTYFQPKKGDWIEEQFFFPNRTQSFELMAPNSEPVWRFSDEQNTLYRVHTKRVA